MKRNIVYVIGSLACGGAENQLLMLIRGLKGSEFVPSMFVLEAKGALKEEVEKSGIEIYDGGYVSSALKPIKLILLLRALWRLTLLLKVKDASIVHGFLPMTNFLAVLAGRFSFSPFIVTSRRALNTHQDQSFVLRYMDKVSSRLSNVIVVNSRAVLQDTLHRETVSTSKISVIYNGILTKRFRDLENQRENIRQSLGITPSQLVLIIVANLIPYKGHKELLEALAMLLPEYPELCLLIVGEDRGIKQHLEKQSERLDISNSIRWLGLRDDIPELLCASDIYVCASHEEGFSNALLEALASGKAVVATNVGGNSEMLESGKLGLLVDANDINGLSHAIKMLLDDAKLRKTFGGKAAKEVANQYRPEYMIDAHLELYRKGCG